MSARIASARELRARLADLPAPGSFSEAELDGLPDPVRRYFKTAVAPGTPLARSARFRMVGSIKLGERWVPSRVRQIEAPHHGFVWSARAGVIVGSDRYAEGHGTMNWRVVGLVRVMHAHGPDVSREVTGHSSFDGVTIPSSGRAGWFYGTDRWDEGEIDSFASGGSNEIIVLALRIQLRPNQQQRSLDQLL